MEKSDDLVIGSSGDLKTAMASGFDHPGFDHPMARSPDRQMIQADPLDRVTGRE